MNALAVLLITSLSFAVPLPEAVQPKSRFRLKTALVKLKNDPTPRLKTTRQTMVLPDGYQVQTMQNEHENWRFFFSPKHGWIGALILKSRIEEEIDIKSPILVIINEEPSEKSWMVAYLLLTLSKDELNKLDVRRKPNSAGTNEEFLNDLRDYITRASH